MGGFPEGAFFLCVEGTASGASCMPYSFVRGGHGIGIACPLHPCRAINAGGKGDSRSIPLQRSLAVRGKSDSCDLRCRCVWLKVITCSNSDVSEVWMCVDYPTNVVSCNMAVRW